MSILFVLSLISLAFGLRLEIENLDQPYIPDEYIITYHLNTTVDQASSHWDLMDSVGIEFIHKYNAGYHKGFAAKITDAKIVTALQEDPLVMAIQVNGLASIQQHSCNNNQDPCPSWGLARLSHRGPLNTKPLTNVYKHSDTHSGEGVDIYIIDTGIQIQHTDFEGRARWGASFADGGSLDDRNGHGTHCAGTAAGLTFGVAKKANLVAVKVLSASGGGAWADVIAGVNHLANNGAPGKSVGSMSLGGGGSNTGLTTAIQNCIKNMGIPIVVAAGNSNADACGFTPAGIDGVISVGATERAGVLPNPEFDNRASFSNYGARCVHIMAPGRDITSSWIGSSNRETNTISGTSMACPHVAGYAAALLSSETVIPPEELLKQIQETAQKVGITNLNGSPDLLLSNTCNH